ncbi:MFS transporter [Streptomyces sp. NBC_00989]|uniref:MFS transporter n=1 Tax=Streptomyces sp. NBC_00989 TaxID=2903705 RepID=UPI003867975B|nr:MFS transporter [Streptomyces sp. NBC_00989]
MGLTATVYLIGQVAGSLVFGDLFDRLGRRRLFLVTLGLYLVASGLTSSPTSTTSPTTRPRSTCSPSPWATCWARCSWAASSTPSAADR